MGRLLPAFFLLLLSTGASADFILSAPPREDPTEATKLYGPLAQELARAVGEKVTFEPAVSWASYSENMRGGKYDFVLDGPHFVAWRAAHIGHVPLVRLEGPLSFSVFTKKDGPAALADLKFKNVCVMASPNLAAVVLLSQFDAYTAPNLLAPRGGVKGSFEAFQENRCHAVMLPSFFIDRQPKEKMADMRKLFTSAQMPNIALTAGPRVKPEQRAAVVKALESPALQVSLKTMLDALGSAKENRFVPARSEDYAGHQQLLEGVVWGW